MNSYLSSDYAGKTHKRICRKIICRLAASLAKCLGGTLDYIGMGSLFYEDFLVFYASGCIRDMTSIEYMLDANGKFDELKYRRFLLNRPFESIRLLPLSVREAVEQLSFDQNCLVWFDYDSTITRETIEEAAEVLRKAEKTCMLASCTGTQVAYDYKAERRTLDMEAVRSRFQDMLTPETANLFATLSWDYFTDIIRDCVTPYYRRLVNERNEREHRSFKLFQVARIEYRQPSRFVVDIWLLLDTDRVDEEIVREQVLKSADAGFHKIDMPVLTEREKGFIGSHLDKNPTALADELALDEECVKKYLRYWEDYCEY